MSGASRYSKASKRRRAVSATHPTSRDTSSADRETPIAVPLPSSRRVTRRVLPELPTDGNSPTPRLKRSTHSKAHTERRKRLNRRRLTRPSSFSQSSGASFMSLASENGLLQQAILSKYPQARGIQVYNRDPSINLLHLYTRVQTPNHTRYGDHTSYIDQILELRERNALEVSFKHIIPESPALEIEENRETINFQNGQSITAIITDGKISSIEIDKGDGPYQRCITASFPRINENGKNINGAYDIVEYTYDGNQYKLTSAIILSHIGKSKMSDDLINNIEHDVNQSQSQQRRRDSDHLRKTRQARRKGLRPGVTPVPSGSFSMLDFPEYRPALGYPTADSSEDELTYLSGHPGLDGAGAGLGEIGAGVGLHLGRKSKGIGAGSRNADHGMVGRKRRSAFRRVSPGSHDSDSLSDIIRHHDSAGSMPGLEAFTSSDEKKASPPRASTTPITAGGSRTVGVARSPDSDTSSRLTPPAIAAADTSTLGLLAPSATLASSHAASRSSGRGRGSSLER